MTEIIYLPNPTEIFLLNLVKKTDTLSPCRIDGVGKSYVFGFSYMNDLYEFYVKASLLFTIQNLLSGIFPPPSIGESNKGLVASRIN